MASLCRRLGCHQSARAAAYYYDFLLYRRWLNLVALDLASDHRIHGAAAGKGVRALRHAGKAAQAVYNLLVSAFHDLAWQVRIS